jgi:hypothetical protein
MELLRRSLVATPQNPPQYVYNDGTVICLEKGVPGKIEEVISMQNEISNAAHIFNPFCMLNVL